jgi:P-type Ca2+ transporter type 2C
MVSETQKSDAGSTSHIQDVAGVLGALGADASSGLSTAEAGTRLDRNGPNELIETSGRGPWLIIYEQLSSAMVMLLFVAGGVSLYLGEVIDATAIVAIIVLNALLGFVQDYRAEKALAALKKLAVPLVHARRDGTVVEIPARELVTGDVVVLEAGNLVPADCRVIESASLKIQESTLTGESDAVEKSSDALPESSLAAPLGDRSNMAWMGTIVTYGHGAAVVVETGMRTQLGQIATSLQTVEAEQTPLQRRLAQMGRTLAIVALGIVAVIFAVGVSEGVELKQMLMTALSLAVAVVPEGLPAVATVSLALGARRMFQRHALIRKLPAVETLGSVTVICSDKTGTLTQNRMTVSMLDVAGKRLDLSEELRQHDPVWRFSQQALTKISEESSLGLLLAGASLCNDATIESDPEQRTHHTVGEPTEAALVEVAARCGFEPSSLNQLLPRIAEIPFDSARKCMTTLHRISAKDDVSVELKRALAPLLDLDDSDCLAFTKGAVDRVLDRCDYIWDGSDPASMDDGWRERIITAHDEMAGDGMRVLAVAFRPVDGISTGSTVDESIENELIFIGLLAIIDPPRPEVRDAVTRCRSAGIRPVMITGDHPLTALNIAQQLGIADERVTIDDVLIGERLSGMKVEDLEPVVDQVCVYARVAPKDKLHIVQALQNRGQVVSMTGDGVNDAPALKQSHIGVAMGIMGTDVSKEASDMILLDDNFATIVNAVEQGRIVYDNIRKFIRYTMTSNAGEICVMILGPLVGMPMPLLPLQILWINLVTDGLPGLALAMEPEESNTMKRPPYPPDEHVMGGGMAIDIVWIGLLMGIISLAMGYYEWSHGAADDYWRTVVFTVLTLSQMGNVMAIRSQRDSLFTIGIFSNPSMTGSVLLTFVMQLGVIYLPFAQKVFHTVPLSMLDLAGCLLLSTVVFWGVELKKWWLRREISRQLPAVAERPGDST